MAYARIKQLPDGRRVTCSLYNIWHSMRERCLCATYRDYKYYGGRGITICAEWSDYAVFRAWAISRGFSKGMTLDRENVNGNYEPGNCRWLHKSLQQDNTRRVIKLTVAGITKPLPEWARLRGLSPEVIRSRIRLQGWSHDRAVLTPVGEWRKPRSTFGRIDCGDCGRSVARRADDTARKHRCTP